GQDEEAALAPLEGLFTALVVPDAAGAAAAQDVDGLVVHVVLGDGGAPGRDLDDVLVLAVVTVHVAESALDALARPGADLDGLHVLDVNAANQRHPLFLAPLLIRIDPLDYRGRFSGAWH